LRGTGPPLARRVGALWRRERWPGPGSRVVVAFSGGLDSLVLLHLLRFPLRSLGLQVIVGHFDHAMRPGSRADARWARGLAASWGLPFRRERAKAPPAGEAEARRLRYEFLERVVREEDAELLLTAHHAEDQAETILFRILRGTGIHGLAGIPRYRPPGIVRPLLAESGETLDDYADRARLSPRIDPTNLESGPARNRIRREILPRLLRVHPGAREGILRLGRNARRTAEALDALVKPLLEVAVAERGPGRTTLFRDRFLECPSPVQPFLLRAVLREVGTVLDEAGTAAALEFIRKGRSGGRLHLPGSLRLARDFDLLRLSWEEGGSRRDEEAAGVDDVPFVLRGEAGPGEDRVPGATEGAGRARIGGRRFTIRWGGVPPIDGPAESTEAFDGEALAFPLTVRGWAPGDRTRTWGGGRKLKKLFGELKVPVNERHRLPLVVDGRGEVIWIPGWHRAPVATPREGTGRWYLGIWHEDGNA
jgi:tRNA(Ile)-lysidine synthase